MRHMDAMYDLDLVKKPIRMPKMAREALLSELREQLRHAKMEHCSFREYDGSSPVGKDVTAYVREVTHLWRQTWVIPQLQYLIKAFSDVRPL